MTYQLSDLLLFPTIVQGFFIAIILVYKKKQNINANRILAMIMVCSALMLIGRMVYWRFPEGWLVQIIMLPDTIIFLFGPLIYFFVKKLFTDKAASINYWHFSPAVGYLLMVIYFFTLGASYFDELIKTPQIWVLFFWVETLGLISNLLYTTLSMYAFFKYINNEKEYLSYHQSASSFIRYFLIAIVGCQVLWVMSYVSINIFRYLLPVINYSSIWFSLPLISYVVGYYMLTQPEIFQQSPTLANTKKNQHRLHVSTIEQLKTLLGKKMLVENAYTNSELTLSELSEQLGTTANNLSWLLNEVYRQNFYDFINNYRIDAFISKANNGEHVQKTILSLALEVGFKSKSTFNKAFKSIHNTTPSKYIKEHIPDEGIKFKYTA